VLGLNHYISARNNELRVTSYIIHAIVADTLHVFQLHETSAKLINVG
jgi:hypothetical protein